MKKFFITLLLLFAIWVRVPIPEPIAFKAWCYVQTVRKGYIVTLASIVQYEYGYVWRVYRKPSSSVIKPGGLYGVEKTLYDAKNKVYFQLLGSRMI